MEFLFLCFYIKAVFEDSLENLTDMFALVWQITDSWNKAFIKIDNDEIIKEVSNNISKKRLEDVWGINEPKCHKEVFEMSPVVFEGHLPLISITYSDGVTGVTEV